MVSHGVAPSECHTEGCGNMECRPVANGADVALRCDVCCTTSQGGRRGLWRHGRIPIVLAMMVYHGAVEGCSRDDVNRHCHGAVSKQVWTDYVMDCGMVLGEFN